MMKVQHGYAPGVRMPGAQPGPMTASGVTSAMASAGPPMSVTTSAPASTAASGRNGSALLHATTRRAVRPEDSTDEDLRSLLESVEELRAIATEDPEGV
jgi:hypothetical protein